SQHSEMLFQGEEDIADFADALAVENDRMLGRRIPPCCTKPFALQYRALSRYAGQVERFISVFGRDRVCVVLHDDLIRDGSECYSRILRFLEVDPRHEPQFRPVNSNKSVRWSRLRDTLRDTSPGSWTELRSVARFLVRNPRARAGVRRCLHSLNTKNSPRKPVDQALRRSLMSEATRDVHELERLIERDLGMWLNPE
ncbi:MAG: hypothetical protein ACRD6W_07170, partial [Nitrososphaerales archaeon]